MFSTEILDKKMEELRESAERQRKKVLDKLVDSFSGLAEEFSFSSAYVIGSLMEPYKFFSDSDVDIAVEGLHAAHYFGLASRLSVFVERDVDLIELEKCEFADRIRKCGLRWKRQN